jgi:hypothetical protein
MDDGEGGYLMEDCIHVWQIAEAHGPQSLGVCKNCGEQREFKNYIEQKGFGRSMEYWLKLKGNSSVFRSER